jgi:hypothetical protein
MATLAIAVVLGTDEADAWARMARGAWRLRLRRASSV